MIAQKTFYYVRHGQTEWNLIGKLQGNSDTPLNQTGISQAYEARDKLAGLPIATICCSPLKRALKTADIINQSLKCPIVEIDGLRECNFGSLEGSFSHDWLGEWLSGDANKVPPEVEPIVEFLARTTAAVNLALEHAGPVLIVAHGGTYMPINKSLPPNQQWNLPNCQPVRHDPPGISGNEWEKFRL